MKFQYFPLVFQESLYQICMKEVPPKKARERASVTPLIGLHVIDATDGTTVHIVVSDILKFQMTMFVRNANKI